MNSKNLIRFYCNDNLGAISNLVNKKIKKNFQHPISVIFMYWSLRRKNKKFHLPTKF